MPHNKINARAAKQKMPLLAALPASLVPELKALKALEGVWRRKGVGAFEREAAVAGFEITLTRDDHGIDGAEVHGKHFTGKFGYSTIWDRSWRLAWPDDVVHLATVFTHDCRLPNVECLLLGYARGMKPRYAVRGDGCGCGVLQNLPCPRKTVRAYFDECKTSAWSDIECDDDFSVFAALIGAYDAVFVK